MNAEMFAPIINSVFPFFFPIFFHVNGCHYDHPLQLLPWPLLHLGAVNQKIWVNYTHKIKKYDGGLADLHHMGTC